MKSRQLFKIMKTTVLGVVISACVPFLLPACVGAFCFEEAGKLYGVNPSLLQSIARVESGLNPKAININKNGSEDLGLMQINSEWIEKMQLSREELLSNPCYNVTMGARILKECIDRWGYTWQAVGCYNAVSRTKRVDYSWKIYRALKKEGTRIRKMAKSEVQTPELKRTDQSLRFRVRSMDGTDVGSKP